MYRVRDPMILPESNFFKFRCEINRRKRCPFNRPYRLACTIIRCVASAGVVAGDCLGQVTSEENLDSLFSHVEGTGCFCNHTTVGSATGIDKVSEVAITTNGMQSLSAAVPVCGSDKYVVAF